MNPLAACGWLWLTWLCYWMLEGLRASKAKWRQPRLARLAHDAGLAFGFVLIFRSQPPSPALRAGALWISATATGLGFSVWARRHLGRHWSGNVTIKEGHEVIDTGPYAFVRHPIYTGFLSAAWATAAAASSPRAALGAALITATIWWKMGLEERALEGEFGAAYRAYMTRTKRLFPFLV